MGSDIARLEVFACICYMDARVLYTVVFDIRVVLFARRDETLGKAAEIAAKRRSELIQDRRLRRLATQD